MKLVTLLLALCASPFAMANGLTCGRLAISSNGISFFTDTKRYIPMLIPASKETHDLLFNDIDYSSAGSVHACLDGDYSYPGSEYFIVRSAFLN